MANCTCNELQLRVRSIIDWDKLLYYLSGEYEQDDTLSNDGYARIMLRTSCDPSNLTATMDRAAELIKGLPDKAKQMLLTPIEHCLINLETVFYVKNASSNVERVPISFEDFLSLVSCYFATLNGEDLVEYGYKIVFVDDSTATVIQPEQILSALSFILEGDYETIGTNSTDYPPSSISELRRGSYSTISVLPPLPLTPPPNSPVRPSNNQRTEQEPIQKKWSTRRLRFFIFIMAILSIIVLAGIAAAIYFGVKHSGNRNNPNENNILIEFVSESADFPIQKPDRVKTSYDYFNNQVIVTSPEDDGIQTFALEFTWDGTPMQGNNTNFTVNHAFTHCGVHAIYTGRKIYCCCNPSPREEVFCSGPDSAGRFCETMRNDSYIDMRMNDFLDINGTATFVYMEQYQEGSTNKSYFTLIFHPNNVRQLSHDEVYYLSEDEQWTVFAFPRILRTGDHSVEMILKIKKNSTNVSEYALCNYLLGGDNGTMIRNNCTDLNHMAKYIDRTKAEGATFDVIYRNGTKLWVVAPYSESRYSSNNEHEKKSIGSGKSASSVIQLPLFIYKTSGEVVASTFYEYNVKSCYQIGGPLFMDNLLHVFIIDSDPTSGKLLQFKYDFNMNV